MLTRKGDSSLSHAMYTGACHADTKADQTFGILAHELGVPQSETIVGIRLTSQLFASDEVVVEFLAVEAGPAINDINAQCVDVDGALPLKAYSKAVSRERLHKLFKTCRFELFVSTLSAAEYDIVGPVRDLDDLD